MLHSFFRGLLGAVAIAFFFFATGCGEDPRFSAKTQYLGGVYGGAPSGAPHDTVSYWDGDSVQGKPSITIRLREPRAYFYKSGVLVGVSQLCRGRESIDNSFGHYYVIQNELK